MSINLPEPYVGLTGVERAALIEHAEQVQRNFERIAREWTSTRVDTVHAIGAAGEPAFANGWVNHAAGRPAEFYRSGERVYLRGLVSTGTVGLVMFTLPVGYRPSAAGAGDFPVVANNLFGVVAVTSAGSVILTVGSNVSVDLSSVHFRVA